MSKLIDRIKSVLGIGIKPKEVKQKTTKSVVAKPEVVIEEEKGTNPKARKPKDYKKVAKKRRKIQKLSRVANRSKK